MSEKVEAVEEVEVEVKAPKTTRKRKTKATTKEGATVKIVNEQLAVFDFGLTLDELRLAQALDAESTVIRNTDGDVIFAVTEADTPYLSYAGAGLSEKRDLMVQHDAPIDAEDVKRLYGASLIKVSAVVVKIKEAIKDAGSQMDSAISEVNI